MNMSFLFKKKKNDSPDILGKYPEYMQVPALPERRYIKTSRILSILVVINIAFIILFSAIFTYVADRVDVSLTKNNAIHMYHIDSSRKTLVPLEPAQRSISAIDLYVEQVLRDYIKNRHEIVWDDTIKISRWDDRGGIISRYSDFKSVLPYAKADYEIGYNESRVNEFVRDVHLLELRKVYGNLWEGVFDTFDMPIPDSYNPLCPCSDNSQECLSCKMKHSSRHMRFRVYMRYVLSNEKVALHKELNPLGIKIVSYDLLYVPIHDNEHYWGIPSELKPDL